jgi:SWIM/SEC-C metal-binding protein
VTRIGSPKRPAIVRVNDQDRSQEIIDICKANEWHVIVGIEPDEPEDITDFLKLQNPEHFTVRVEPTVGRNDPCPCGSGSKYKKCCLRTPAASATTSRQS